MASDIAPLKFNSAYRVARIIDDCILYTANDRQERHLAAWGKVFSIESEDVYSDQMRVIQLLRLTSKQVEDVEQHCETLGLPRRLYEPTLRLVRQATSPDRFNSTWSNSYDSLKAQQVPLILDYISILLSEEEALVPEEDLNFILEALDEHVIILQESGIDGLAVGYVNQQFDVIREAVRSYPIEGASVFTDGVYEAFKHRTTFYHEAPTAEGVEREDVEKAASIVDAIWTKVKRVVDKASVDLPVRLLTEAALGALPQGGDAV